MCQATSRTKPRLAHFGKGAGDVGEGKRALRPQSVINTKQMLDQDAAVRVKDLFFRALAARYTEAGRMFCGSSPRTMKSYSWRTLLLSRK